MKTTSISRGILGLFIAGIIGWVAVATVTAEISADQVKRLSSLLEKGLEEKVVSDQEVEEIESLLLLLLPDQGAHGEAVEWKVNYSNGDNADGDESDFITMDLYEKGKTDSVDKLMWFHVLYNKKADRDYGYEKFGRYGAMRAEGRHLFTMIGKTEIRAVADAAGYEDDKKIDAIVEAMDLDAIKKL